MCVMRRAWRCRRPHRAARRDDQRRRLPASSRHVHPRTASASTNVRSRSPRPRPPQSSCHRHFTRDELVREGFEPDRIHCVPLATRITALRSLSTIFASRRAPQRARGLSPRRRHHRAPESTPRSSPRSNGARASTRSGVGDRGRAGLAPDTPRRSSTGPESSCSVTCPTERSIGCTEAPRSSSTRRSTRASDSRSSRPSRSPGRSASAIPAHIELVGDAARLFPTGDVDTLAAVFGELWMILPSRDKLALQRGSRARHFSMATTIEGHVTTYQHAAAR